MKKEHKPVEFSKITEFIYIGTNMCENHVCSLHFGKLKSLKIKSDIDLEKERIEKPHDLEAYLWLPTKDNSAPSQSNLRLGVVFIDEMVKQKKRVYVHCRLGHGRSPALVAAYFISKGMNVDEAINYIKKRRPEIHLAKSQYESLKLFKKNFKK